MNTTDAGRTEKKQGGGNKKKKHTAEASQGHSSSENQLRKQRTQKLGERNDRPNGIESNPQGEPRAPRPLSKWVPPTQILPKS